MTGLGRRRDQEFDQVVHGTKSFHEHSKDILTLTARFQTSRQVQIMSTLPLKALSRLWGRFNELDIPYYLRVPGFKLYSFIFGVK